MAKLLRHAHCLAEYRCDDGATGGEQWRRALSETIFSVCPPRFGSGLVEGCYAPVNQWAAMAPVGGWRVVTKPVAPPCVSTITVMRAHGVSNSPIQSLARNVSSFHFNKFRHVKTLPCRAEIPNRTGPRSFRPRANGRRSGHPWRPATGWLRGWRSPPSGAPARTGR